MPRSYQLLGIVFISKSDFASVVVDKRRAPLTSGSSRNPFSALWPYSFATTNGTRRHGPFRSATRSVDIIDSFYQKAKAASSTPNEAIAAANCSPYHPSNSHHLAGSRAKQQGSLNYKASVQIGNVAYQSMETQQTARQIMTPGVVAAYFRSQVETTAAPILQHPTYGSGASSSVHQQDTPLSYGDGISSVNMQHPPPAGVDAGVPEYHEYHHGAVDERWVSYQKQLCIVF